MQPRAQPIPTADFARRSGLWLLYLLPLVFVCTIAAVTVHEVLGHGCTAIAVGGELQAFRVGFDANGWAQTVEPPEYRVLVFAGGIAVETVLGFVLLGLAVWLRPPLLPRAGALLLATCLLHDGLPYGFWGAVFPDGSGDTCAIVTMYGSAGVRWFLVATLGSVYVAMMFATGMAIFRCLEDALGPLGSGRAVALAALFTLSMGTGYWLFDMESVVPGAHKLPAFVAAGIQALVGAAFVCRRRAAVSGTEPSRAAWGRAVLASWIAAALVAAVVALWLDEGVRLA